MDEALLSYYNRELAYLRKLGAEFAERHPKIAGRLRLDKDVVEDPHVSRLIESFAFLTARLRHKLDDGFPELTEALMGLLYPDYHAPIPSLTIAQMSLVPERPEPLTVPRGTMLLTQSNPLGACFYRTCFDTELQPLTVTGARFSAQPFRAPTPPARRGNATQGLLALTLTAHPGARLSELAPSRLRFFLNGQPQLTGRLYELLLQNATAIAIAAHPQDPEAVFLSPERLRPCGFTEAEAALPPSGRAAPAHRLLAEYFAFPEKFLFVELEGLDGAWSRFEHQAQLYIYFDQAHPELMQGVSAESLLLGCAPLVNLFEERLETFSAAEAGYETRLSVDATHSRCAEIHTLTQVYARDAAGNRKLLSPFYGSHRQAEPDGVYWHVRREPSQWHNGRASRGSELFLSFVDPDFRISAPEGHWLIGGEALCTNRDLPDKLPFGPGQPHMEFAEGAAGVRVRCVTAPTASLQPRLSDATRWQLVTQLSLQHFGGSDGLEILKETLRLYDFRQLPETRAIIEGIVGVRTRLAVDRIVRGGRAAVCQGTEIELELDEPAFSGASLYLFTAVLSEFFAQYCTINTFTRLSVRVRQRPGRLIQWPSRSGSQPLT